jgi:hypothetical protein
MASATAAAMSATTAAAARKGGRGCRKGNCETGTNRC